MVASHKRKVKHFVVLGDSLSDRGMLWDRKFLGLNIMRQWSGLIGKSPNERFTNGYVWLDFLAKKFVKDFSKKEVIKNNSSLYLQDEERIKWMGHDFIRSFAEGGVSAHQFIFTPGTTFIGFVTRLILATLSTMRNLLIKDDKKEKAHQCHKEETLIIDWTGANDLITVNLKPTIEEVRLAIKARIKNCKELIRNGYHNILLFNLPDLSLTPRFQKMSEADRVNANACIDEFNKLLQDEVNKIKIIYPQCNVDVYDICNDFKKIYNDPEKFSLDKNKLTQPFTTSPDFHKPTIDMKTMPSKRYMFWDDIHPTASAHKVLAKQAKVEIERLYKVCDPNKRKAINLEWEVDAALLIAAFKKKYSKNFNKDRLSFFGEKYCSRISHRFDDLDFSLVDIFDHALNKGGKRTFRILQSLQWLDGNGQLNLENIPALREAYSQVVKLLPADIRKFKS